MVGDPYAYPGTETFRNRLGITDENSLTEAERRLTLARSAEAGRLTFPATADGYRALHKHLFQDLYEWAGQDRTVNIAKGGSSFAAVPYVARELDKLFTDMSATNDFRGLPRDEFFDRLGNHINEINAIHPFREGNGRTMRQHAAQIARDAGHPIRIAAIDKDRWMEASRHGFLTGDHRGMAAVLSAAAIKRDLAPEPRIGPAGIALLPNRAPPEGQRYRVTLTKAREELERYLPAARQQAVERLRGLIKEDASSAAIANARTELAYVRHAKGPVYQSHLLTYLGVRQVDAVISAQQTPLERVREIGAALGIQINVQQQAHIQRAVRALQKPVLPPGHSPGQERLAAAFLKNTPEMNHADPRLAPAQAIVDAAMQTARDRGESARMVGTIGDSTRQLVADRIKSGDTLDPKIGGVAPATAPRDKDRRR
ncbi:Fic/DOC family protein [Rhizorhapis suberifaciens]|uniref:protein adenylyltransferase n=1 Tax=Rhizorhapis suberifaciens TaxID=13656 RepID=A0A840HX99_9SPHN|nr:Fic family protein [Rhizorhapis suberifaciens]MBB4642715.1 cell filamentation protein [Rhizorhapis suberifaciens]